MTQMCKNLEFHAALAVLQGQMLRLNVDIDLFLYFTLRGKQRGFTLFYAAGNRLPELRIVAPL
ncbi:hypothetical protein D3C72_2487710 [compost metagenome]